MIKIILEQSSVKGMYINMIKEDVKEQQEKLKGKSFKEKFQYFWYYYKVHTMVAIVGIIAVIIFAKDIIRNSREPAIYAILANSNLYSVSETKLMDDYIASRQINIEEHPATLDVSISMIEDTADSMSLANSQKLMALFQAGDIDIFVGDSWIVDSYASVGGFANLKEVLPAELYKKVEKDLIYFEYEEDGKVPIGIQVKDNEKIMQNHTYDVIDSPIITIGMNSSRIETAVDFITYLYE